MSSPEEGQDRRKSRDRIVEAALDLAGREGLDALTTRAVAREAGVNVGLLHYYFESKDALVEETLGRYLGNAVAGADQGLRAVGDGSSPEERLAALLDSALTLASKRPGLIFGIVGRLVTAIGRGLDQEIGMDSARPLPIAIRLMARTQGELFRRVKPILEERLGADPELVGRRAIQVFTSVFHPVIFTPFPGLIFGVDLRDEKARRAYVLEVAEAALRPR